MLGVEDRFLSAAQPKFLAQGTIYPDVIESAGSRTGKAHVIKSRLSELQSARRGVVRTVGQQIAHLLTDIEENVVSKARRALFGDDFAPLYDLLKNRLVFLDGGKDDVFFLEHYVLLGNYARDPDRFEAMDELFQDFLRSLCG